jgi:isoaspartyl peptidase/L-asparaginase-like protein (Ntn-hydrolase superfamily)
MVKNLFITALLLRLSCLCSHAQQCEYALAVHGGAGNLSATENDPVSCTGHGEYFKYLYKEKNAPTSIHHTGIGKE